MSFKKKILIYLIVAVLVICICLLFINVFDFEKDKIEEENLPEVDRTLIEKLYNYIPVSNDYEISTMYTGYYTTYNNLNYEVVENMIYEYILKYDTRKLEIITIDELNIPNKEGVNPLYKLNTSTLEETLPIIFGPDVKLKLMDFNISFKTIAKLDNEAFYIYNHESDRSNNNYVIFKSLRRYSITDNNKTIKIYDYYLKCEIETSNCYDDEKKTILNKYIKYNRENFNINDYSNYLKEYEHVFKYDNGYYYWASSQSV